MLILRVVGTYTLRKTLAILLDPATLWSLDTSTEEVLVIDNSFNRNTESGHHQLVAAALMELFACLATRLSFIYVSNVKHMDIKPKILLVRRCEQARLKFKIYIADFGIARPYKPAAGSETDSPTSFIPTYAPPEILLPDKRGLSATTFSLACVCIEMFAAVISTPHINQHQRLCDIRTSGASRDTSFWTDHLAVKT